MRVTAWILPIAFALTICCSGAEPQPPAGVLDSSKFVSVTSVTSVDAARPGDTFYAGVALHIKQDFHTYGTPLPEYLIPTKLAFEKSAGFSIGPVNYPQPKEEYFEVLKSSIMTYQGTIVVAAEVKANQRVKPGNYKIVARITYQACDQNACYRPIKDKQIDIPIRIVPADQPVKEANRDLFAFSGIGRGPQPGDQAPDFSLKDSAGNTVTLSQFKGKQNLLIIFRSGTQSTRYFESLLDKTKEIDKMNSSLLQVAESATTDFDRYGLTRRLVGSGDVEPIAGLVIVDKNGKIEYGKAIKVESDWPEINLLLERLKSASNSQKPERKDEE